MEQLFCPEPFVNMNITPYMMFPCCESYMKFSDAADLKVATVMVDRAWSMPQWKAFRKKIRNHDYSLCQNCPRYKIKDMWFKTASQMREEYGEDVYKYLTGESTDIESPHTVILSYDSTCNLACPTCRTGPTKQNPMLTEIYSVKSTRAISNARHLIVAGDGEVCLSQNYMNDMAKAPQDAEITLMSNGTLMNEDFWGKLSGNGVINRIRQVNVSCDGTTKEIFEETRKHGNFERFCENMELLSQLKGQYGFRTKLCYTISTPNVSDYRNVPDFARRYGFDELDMTIAVKWERLIDGNIYHSQNIITDPAQTDAIRNDITQLMTSYKLHA